MNELIGLKKLGLGPGGAGWFMWPIGMWGWGGGPWCMKGGCRGPAVGSSWPREGGGCMKFWLGASGAWLKPWLQLARCWPAPDICEWRREGAGRKPLERGARDG